MLNAYPLFDAHLHIINPAHPLTPNEGYLPPSFTAVDYRARLAAYDLKGGAIVSGSFQAFDQGYLRDALATLGPGFVGVTQLPQDVSDAEILDLNACGVRALRFNLKRGGSEGLDQLERMAARVYELAAWHVEFYVDATLLADLGPRLARLPAYSIDHLGLSRAGLPDLLRLVEQGARVKACGFARGDLDIPATLKAIHSVNPEALMFGTDLPSTRAPRPYTDEDLIQVIETLGEAGARRVLYENGWRWYVERRGSVDR